MVSPPRSSDSDSDTDAEEAQRLRSVAIDSASIAASAAIATPAVSSSAAATAEAGPAPKFYQSRARDLLSKYIDNTLEIRTSEHDTHIMEHDEDNSGFYLFRCAPPGISDKHPLEDGLQRTRKMDGVTKKIKSTDEDLDESSKKFRSRISAAAIDGMSVKATAEKAAANAFSSFLLYQAKEKETQRKEAERVALLKARRGERWLPSVSKAIAAEKVFEDKLLEEVRSSRHKKQVGTYI